MTVVRPRAAAWQDPPAAPTEPAYGFNVSTSLFVGSENMQQCHDRYLNTFEISQLPIGKIFRQTTPSTWDSTYEGVVSGRRVIYCYRPVSNIATTVAGGDDAEISALAAAVPRGWYVRFVFWQEHDDDVRDGTITAAQYRAVYARHYPLIHAAQKAPSGGLPGNKLELWSCGQAPMQLSLSVAQSAAMMPLADDCDGYGWDCYLNPFGVAGPTGGIGYESSYSPTFQDRFEECLQVNDLMGVSRYGVMEFGAPWRNWDTGAPFSTGGVAGGSRNNALMTGINWLNSQDPAPEMWALFDSIGTNWDQRFVADGVPTTFTHTGHTPSTVSHGMTGDEPFTASFADLIRGGNYAPFSGMNPATDL